MERDLVRRLDTDLVVTLDALLAEGNVTRAAGRLGIRQSALSGRLTRLRAILNDRLFVPAADGRGVVATPRALALRPAVEAVLGLLDGMVRDEGGFDPATTRRTFTIALHEIPAVTLASDLVPRMAAMAPAARLVLRTPDAAIAERLERGEVDVCIAALEMAHAAWQSRTLFEDGFLTAQRKGHPRGTASLDLDAFCAAGHVVVSADGGGVTGQVDAALASHGRLRRVALSVQSYTLAPTAVAASDLLCTLPARFLQRYAAVVDLFVPPVPLEAKALSACWHPRVQDDPAHRWLREQLFAAAAATTGRELQRLP